MNIFGEGQDYINNCLDEEILKNIFKTLIVSDDKNTVISTLTNIAKFPLDSKYFTIFIAILNYFTINFSKITNDEELHEVIYVFVYMTEKTPEFLSKIVENNFLEPITNTMM
jgi:hypothetical protein